MVSSTVSLRARFWSIPKGRFAVASPVDGFNSPRERQTGSRHLDLSREDGCGLSAIDRESELFPHVSQDEDFRARGDSELTGLGGGQ